MIFQKDFFLSSIGKKMIMGASGICLALFLIVHFLGNLLLYAGAEPFNRYAHMLTSNLFFPIAEWGLLSLFLLHAILAGKLTYENRRARGSQPYAQKRNSGAGATLLSSTMPYTGTVVLIFLILHIVHFRLGTVYSVSYNGDEMRDLYRLVIEFFQSPMNTLFYVTAMVMLSGHLLHGVQSAFQSLSMRTKSYAPLARVVGHFFVFLVLFGFSSFPIWAYLKGGN